MSIVDDEPLLSCLHSILLAAAAPVDVVVVALGGIGGGAIGAVGADRIECKYIRLQ